MIPRPKWQGTGKTVSSLKAVRGLWKPYYFNAAGISAGDLCRYNDDVTVLGSLDELPDELANNAVLIIDDFDDAAEEVEAGVKQLISRHSFPGKIVIAAQAQPKVDEVGSSVDAVVRMKEETAQLLYTRLRDLSG